MSESELFTMPRTSVESWAGDVLEVGGLLSGLAVALRQCERAGDLSRLPELVQVATDGKQLAGDLLRDMIGHGIAPPADRPPSVLLVPGASSGALALLDEFDPLPRGERRVNAEGLGAMMGVSAGGDDAED